MQQCDLLLFFPEALALEIYMATAPPLTRSASVRSSLAT